MVNNSTISIPKMLHEEICRTIAENPQMGYPSVAEFSKEAIRLRLDELTVQLRNREQHYQHIADLIKAIKNTIELH